MDNIIFLLGIIIFGFRTYLSGLDFYKRITIKNVTLKKRMFNSDFGNTNILNLPDWTSILIPIIAICAILLILTLID